MVEDLCCGDTKQFGLCAQLFSQKWPKSWCILLWAKAREKQGPVWAREKPSCFTPEFGVGFRQWCQSLCHVIHSISCSLSEILVDSIATFAWSWTQQRFYKIHLMNLKNRLGLVKAKMDRFVGLISGLFSFMNPLFTQSSNLGSYDIIPCLLVDSTAFQETGSALSRTQDIRKLDTFVGLCQKSF